MTQQKTILITGVSSGIGKGMAQAFTKRGYTVYGSVRKQADADALSKELGGNYKSLLFDVTDRSAINAAKEQVAKELGGKWLDGLINNAGVAVSGPLMHQPIEEIKNHFEINVFGILNITQAFLPLLGAVDNAKGKRGKIINISSVGGKIAGPFIGAYHGTKFALEGLSHTLRRELLLYGIDVVVIGPGSVNTPIWDKGVDTSPYRQTSYYNALSKYTKTSVEAGKKGYSIEEFGEKVVAIFETKKPKTRYALVPGKIKNWTMPRLLPDRTLDRIIGKMLGFINK